MSEYADEAVKGCLVTVAVSRRRQMRGCWLRDPTLERREDQWVFGKVLTFSLLSNPHRKRAITVAAVDLVMQELDRATHCWANMIL